MNTPFINKAPPIAGKPHIYKVGGWWRVTLWDHRRAGLNFWNKAHVFKDQLQDRDGGNPLMKKTK